jgi:hypothetical protein
MAPCCRLRAARATRSNMISATPSRLKDDVPPTPGCSGSRRYPGSCFA